MFAPPAESVNGSAWQDLKNVVIPGMSRMVRAQTEGECKKELSTGARRTNEMDKGATDHVLTIVRLLAKAADDSRLSPNEVDTLNHNITALLRQDREDFVHAFLVTVREAEGVLTSNVAQKLVNYPLAPK